MLAVSIVSIGILVMLQQVSLNHREMGYSKDRAFAYQKAMAMLAELQSAVEKGEINSGPTLDQVADASHNAVLTTLKDEVGADLPPSHPMSDNQLSGTQWQWSRIIEISTPPGQDRLRYVLIKVYRFAQSWQLQATVGATLALPTRGEPSIRTYDVQVLAASASPSLWINLNAARALLSAACKEIEATDPTVKFRLHWITKLGYGRDPVYAPFLNESNTATHSAPYALWYPGLLDGASGAGNKLFHAELFGARLRTEGGLRNDYDLTVNPHPHSVADQFNHCLRHPEAKALFESRLASGQENADEPPLDLLLNDMLAAPGKYVNTIIFNLHGSGLPMPPLRNYSDAAKSPVVHGGVRVVTHPTRLRTPRDPNDDDNHADSIAPEFRVYAYKSDPASGAAHMGTTPITIQIFGMDLSGAVNASSNPSLLIRRLPGGIDTALGSAGSGTYMGFDSTDGLPPTAAGPTTPFEMYYEVGYTSSPNPHTWIRLYNTPLTCPMVGNDGLPTSQRLYGLEYIPSPVTSGASYSQDLTFSSTTAPKNTARWRIQLPVAALQTALGANANLDQRITVQTRIGSSLATGTIAPVAVEPHNLSTTHTWWAQSPQAVPLTERFQFQGDPRHNPYCDLSNGGDSFPNGYNRHFDDLQDGAVDARPDWTCLDSTRLRAGFGAGVVADAPRFMQILREALQHCGAIFVQPSAPTATTLLLGGNIAKASGTSSPTPTSVAVHSDFLGDAGMVSINTVIPTTAESTTVVGSTVIYGSATGDSFWSKPWLGELVPDALYASYLSTGNLPCDGPVWDFKRAPRTSISSTGATGTSFTTPSGAHLGYAGSVALMHCGSLTATFLHDPALGASPPATPTGAGAASGIKLPFSVVEAYPGPLPYFSDPELPKSTATLDKQFTAHGTSTTSTIAGMVTLSQSSKAGYFCILGLNPASGTDLGPLTKESLCNLRKTFEEGGKRATMRIVQQPKTEILDPRPETTLATPTTVLLRWKTEFDGTPEPEADLVYNVTWSNDDGETWHFAQGGALTNIDERPSAGLMLADAGTGNESYLINLPAALFPAGNYRLRLRCFHKKRLQHVSSHDLKVTITR